MTRLAYIPFALALVGLTGCVSASQPDRAANEPGATRAEFDQWMTELSNWGRWGEDDQMGAANLITDAKRRQAAALVETGEAMSLAHDVTDDLGSDPNRPFGLNMIITFDPDRIRDRLQRWKAAMAAGRVSTMMIAGGSPRALELVAEEML